MERFSCKCAQPLESPNPRSHHTCQRCLGHIDPAWTSNDQTTRAFYDRLGRSIPGVLPNKGAPPSPIADDFLVFRAQCEARELAGRHTFGHRHLSRDNLGDALEEGADFANYLLFHTLQAKRSGGKVDMSIALDAAYDIFKAHRKARILRSGWRRP